MLVNTHGIIANLVYKQLKKDNNCHLSKFSFVLGNIKPDIIKEFREKSHYFEDAIFYVLDRIQEITKLELSREEFSNELGVICHFLSDFFCLFHQNTYKKESIIKHILYEINLHLRFKKMIKVTSFFDKTHDKDLKVFDLNKMILTMHQEYLSKKSTCEEDIVYALKCIFLVTEKLEYDYRFKYEEVFQSIVYA